MSYITPTLKDYIPVSLYCYTETMINGWLRFMINECLLKGFEWHLVGMLWQLKAYNSIYLEVSYDSVTRMRKITVPSPCLRLWIVSCWTYLCVMCCNSKNYFRNRKIFLFLLLRTLTAGILWQYYQCVNYIWTFFFFWVGGWGYGGLSAFFSFSHFSNSHPESYMTNL